MTEFYYIITFFYKYIPAQIYFATQLSIFLKKGMCMLYQTMTCLVSSLYMKSYRKKIYIDNNLSTTKYSIIKSST